MSQTVPGGFQNSWRNPIAVGLASPGSPVLTFESPLTSLSGVEKFCLCEKLLMYEIDRYPNDSS